MIGLHPEYLNRNGQPAFAVLPIEEFHSLKQYLEDLEDLLALRQAKAADKNSSTLDIEQLRRQLKKGTEAVHWVSNSKTLSPGRWPNQVKLGHG
jgi:hypothetical protein